MKHVRWLLALSVVLNLAIIGIVGPTNLLRQVTSRNQFPLLSPRIFAHNQNDLIINFTALRAGLRQFILSQEDFRAGVYFEYLPSGVSIGVNEKEEFISASLIKVPLIMGIYKLIETGTLRPESQLTLRNEDIDSDFGTLWQRGPGTQLSVEEAIRLTLTESDNTAARALDALAKEDPIREVYNALDIPIEYSGALPTVSPKNYSSIFRCLYLSCYLDYGHSQQILELLTRTKFEEGIPAGIPDGVPVAHKIGMYDLRDSTKKVRLDCGIIYVPRRPYILCVLAESEQGQEQLVTDFTKDVSQRVYAFVEKVNLQ